MIFIPLLLVLFCCRGDGGDTGTASPPTSHHYRLNGPIATPKDDSPPVLGEPSTMPLSTPSPLQENQP